jgi:hypothetical protein
MELFAKSSAVDTDFTAKLPLMLRLTLVSLVAAMMLSGAIPEEANSRAVPGRTSRLNSVLNMRFDPELLSHLPKALEEELHFAPISEASEIATAKTRHLVSPRVW